MNSIQVFLILNIYTTQVIFDKNFYLEKLVKSIPGWKLDHNRNKWYIPLSKSSLLIEKLDTNNITWAKSTKNNDYSLLIDNMNNATFYNENLFDIVLNDKIRNGRLHSLSELDHLQKENSVRIRHQSDYSVLVNLPMSTYSFSILNQLKKSYSMDTFGWVFIGENNFKNLYDTCKYNKITLIKDKCI